MPKVARNTITDPDRLRAELRKVRAQGYAYDDMEFADDMRCVAVAVSGKDDSVSGGISISGPGSRFTLHKLRELRDCAIEAAGRLSLRLGGRAGEAARSSRSVCKTVRTARAQRAGDRSAPGRTAPESL